MGSNTCSLSASAATIWQLRVLAGWLPPNATALARTFAASLEIAEIHRRVIAAGGPALLFSNVRNSSFPLVSNLFGTTGRAELAFGERPMALVGRVVDLVRSEMPPSASTLWSARDLAGAAHPGGGQLTLELVAAVSAVG